MYPNPAEGDITIAFTTPESATGKAVIVEAFDVMGRKVWGNEVVLSSGYHEMIWKRNRQEALGVYVVQIKSGVEAKQKRVILK